MSETTVIKMNASPPRKRRSPYNLFFACERELILRDLGSSSIEVSVEKERNASHAIALEDAMTYPTPPARYQNANLANPILASNTHLRKHCRAGGEIALADLCQEISKRWKDADKETRSYFCALSKQDLLRYKKEMTMYTKTITSTETKEGMAELALPVTTSERGIRKRKALEPPPNQAAHRSTKCHIVQNDVGNGNDLSGYVARGVHIIPTFESEDSETAMVIKLAKEQAASISELQSQMLPLRVPQDHVHLESTLSWEQYLDLYKVYTETLLSSASSSSVP